MSFRKVEYTMKAGVGGAGAGLALCGFLTFLPVTVTLSIVTVVTSLVSASLALYTFTQID